MYSTTFVLFGKYYPIVDQLGSKDSSRNFQLNCVISYFFTYIYYFMHGSKIDVMEREWKILTFHVHLNKALYCQLAQYMVQSMSGWWLLLCCGQGKLMLQTLMMTLTSTSMSPRSSGDCLAKCMHVGHGWSFRIPNASHSIYVYWTQRKMNMAYQRTFAHVHVPDHYIFCGNASELSNRYLWV
jgi:hypothetical protein